MFLSGPVCLSFSVLDHLPVWITIDFMHETVQGLGMIT